jgi:hypothetical protein
VGAYLSFPHLLLYRARQILHQPNAAAYPAHTPIELVAEILQILAKDSVQL